MPQVETGSTSANRKLIRSCVFRVVASLVIACCVLAGGCRDEGTTIWSNEVRSPDGHWLATAATKQWSGPGNAYVATSVYLKDSEWFSGPGSDLGLLQRLCVSRRDY